MRYIAFLRGINVGKHKVPMAELKSLMAELGFNDIVTLLNSGNIIFQADQDSPEMLEKQISSMLQKHFGFPIPVFIRRAEEIQKMIGQDPFHDVVVDKSTRLYVTFLEKPREQLPFDIPYISEDRSFRIIQASSNAIFSVLDLEISGTVDAMALLQNFFGKNISTRNWNTIIRIGKKTQE